MGGVHREYIRHYFYPDVMPNKKKINSSIIYQLEYSIFLD